MRTVDKLWAWLSVWEHNWLLALVLVFLILQFIIISSPSVLVFDEYFYVPDARSIIDNGITQRPEHPPLGKLLITTGILIFGDSPIGWRLFPVLFGAGAVILFYFICRELRIPREATLLATFLLVFDNMTFVQASVAMLDVYGLVFLFAAFLLYLRSKFAASGLMIALSSLVKVAGILALPVIALHWWFTGRKDARRFLISMVPAPFFFLFFMFLSGYTISGSALNPFQQVKTMVELSSSITFAYAQHPSASYPWEWVLRPLMMPYWYDPHYVSAMTYTLWIAIIPVIIYLIFRARKGSSAAIFGLAWFVGTYLTWIPMTLITDRVGYIFYFYPTVGAICLGVGLALSDLLQWRRKTEPGRLKDALVVGIAGYLQLHVVIFFILSPLTSTWIKLYNIQQAG